MVHVSPCSGALVASPGMSLRLLAAHTIIDLNQRSQRCPLTPDERITARHCFTILLHYPLGA